MPDIFDDIADLPAGDIFDRIDAKPVAVEPSLQLMSPLEPSKEIAAAKKGIQAEILAPERATGRVYEQPARVPQWKEVEKELPKEMQQYGDKIRNSLSMAATHDIAPSKAFEMHDIFTGVYNENNLADIAQGSFKAGIGDVYTTGGYAAKWLGVPDSITETYIDFGERLRSAYIPPMDQSEFTWRKLSDPEWWATTGVRSVPFMLSLIPGAIVGAYAGAEVAGAYGLGSFGTLVLGSLGGAAVSRPIESTFEAGGVYEEALKRGMSEPEASAAADEVFWGNMKLVGMDAAQFAIAFTPLNKIGGQSAIKIMRGRRLATTVKRLGLPVKFATVGISEAGEERYQETISREALGDPVDFLDFSDPQLNEASVIGAIFGLGMAGSGSAWTGLKTHLVENMEPVVKGTYETARQKAIRAGATEEAAEIQALDEVANTPEGKAYIETTMKELIEIGEGKEVEGAAEKVAALREIFHQEELTDVEPGVAISEQISSQLMATGQFTQDQADLQAEALYGSFFPTMAERAGVDAEALFESYNLQIARTRAERADKDGITYDQAGKVDVKTEAFNKWFAESKITDQAGKPLVVYHGTQAPDFEAFDPAQSDLGSHFGTGTQAAAFTKEAADITVEQGKAPFLDHVTPRTIPVYLNMKNPLRLQDFGAFTGSEVIPQLLDKGLVKEDLIVNEDPELTLAEIDYGELDNAALIEIIQRAGYDGVVYLNRREGLPVSQTFNNNQLDSMTDEQVKINYPIADDSYIAFKPEQIKSVFAQQFDALDPRILYQEQPLDVSSRQFKRWFNGSYVADHNKLPLVVYRGEYGDPQLALAPDPTGTFQKRGQFQARAGSLTFASAKAASTYAMEPNRYGDVAHAPRVTPVYLSIKKPVINTPRDPFIQFNDLEQTLGRDRGKEILLQYAAQVEDTSNWIENYAEKYPSLEKALASAEVAPFRFYLEAYHVLDDPGIVKEFQAEGYDGAIYQGSGETLDEPEYRIFDASQAKSIYETQDVPPPLPAPFYSQLQRVVEADKFPGKAPGDQMMSIIKKGAVKAEEIRWSGVEDFLAGKKVITKAELLAYLRANETEINIIQKGGGAEALTVIEDGKGQWHVYNAADTIVETFETERQANDYVSTAGERAEIDEHEFQDNLTDWEVPEIDEYYESDEYDHYVGEIESGEIGGIDKDDYYEETGEVDEDGNPEREFDEDSYNSAVEDLARDYARESAEHDAEQKQFKTYYDESTEIEYKMIHQESSDEYLVEVDGINVGDFDSEEEALEEIRERVGATGIEGPAGFTEFSEYTEPGGEGYTELLLQLPLKSVEDLTELPAGYDVAHDRTQAEGAQYSVLPPGQKHGQPFAGKWNTPERAKAEALRQVNYNRGRDALKGLFVEGHYSENNILAHVRFKLRFDPAGNRVLFLEEIQSDWALAGRRKGFKRKVTAEEYRRIDSLRREIGNMRRVKTFTDNVTHKALISGESAFSEAIERLKENIRMDDEALAQAKATGEDESVIINLNNSKKESQESLASMQGDGEYSTLEKIATKSRNLEKDIRNFKEEIELIEGKSGGVPEAALLKNWHEFVLKRMLRWAADNGFQKMAWTTGAQQKARYSLEKRVDKIIYWKNEDGTFDLAVTLPYGEGKEVGKGLPLEKLDSYVGKEIADKIIEGKGELTEVSGDVGFPSSTSATGQRQQMALSGTDLKVGGEWAVTLYDNVIPNFLKKYGKKWGAKVEGVDLGINYTKSPDQVVIDKREDGTWFVYSETPEGARTVHGEGFRTHIDAQKLELPEETRRRVIPQQSIRITPEMVASVQAGQPQFQGEKIKKGRIVFGPEGVDIDLLKDADPPTFLHETGHFYLKVLGDLAALDTANQELKDDAKIAADWLGAKSIKDLTREQSEQWARGFEAYLREGKAPSSALRKAFAQFKAWLTEVYKRVKRLNVELTPEIRGVLDRMIASQEDINLVNQEIDEITVDLVAEGKDIEKITLAEIKKHLTPAAKKTVKGLILESVGKRKTFEYIREDKALTASWKKAEQSARKAFKAGKGVEAAAQKEKMKVVMFRAQEKVDKIQTEKQKMAKRRQTINTIKNYLGLSDVQMKGLTARRSYANMTDYEFKKFKDDLLVRAEEVYESAVAKARVMGLIQDKRLEKVENYQRALKLPTISKMSSRQLKHFADLLEPFEDGDVFLTPRELETVDRTDLKGIRTWREAKAALAKEAGVPIEDLATIKVNWTDKFKWDNALAESNPFYKLIVTEINKKLLEAEARSHEVENRIFELAKKSEKSRAGSGWEKIGRKFIPQDKGIMAYMEASKEDKPVHAKALTAAQLDLAHYMQEYFGQALEYLIKIKSLQKGRENYFVHMRRSFLETFKDDGIAKAVTSIFKNYQLEEMAFNILDGDTGNILPLEKFFQFSLRRTGELAPTQNVIKSFLAYSKTFEKKVTLDETIPKLDIYAQSLTPRHYTPRGLEIDRSIKKFVYEYVNNKKGRTVDMKFVKQGDKVDLAIRGLRTFVTILDLGLSIPVGIASFVGEQAANYTMLGERGWVLGTARGRTKKGKAILEKYEAFVGRSIWEEFTQPGKEIGERVIEGMFGFFHQATVTANKQFLLASLSDEEYDSGVIEEGRLAQIRIEQGRFRAVPGAKSLIGSTSPGSAAIQYKGWAVPIMRTVTKDLGILVRDLKNKPLGEALTGREARELFRAIRMTTAVLLVLGLGDKEDKSFMGQLMYKTRREALTVLQAISPDMWLSTPRLVGFASKLGTNLKSLILLEEYKTKPGLKGAGGLKRQFTPGVVRSLKKDEKKGKLKF